MEPILPDYDWIYDFSIRRRKQDLEGKLVGFRFDINSPVGDDAKVVDNPRITTVARYLTKYINEYRCIPIVFCHQGRKGQKDCTSTAKHSELLNAKTPCII